MEFIFELLYEIFLEGCMDTAGNPRVPKWLRILLMSVPFALLETFFVLGIISAVKDYNPFLEVFLLILAGVFLLLWIYLLIKICRYKPFHD